MSRRLPRSASPRPAKGRNAPALLACALACAAAGVAMIASSEATAQQAGQPRVTINPLSGPQASLALRDLAGQEDVEGRDYALRSGSGAISERVTGFSLARLLRLADIDTFGFSYAEVARPAGGSVLLSRNQVLEVGAFPDGPPVVYERGGGLAFLRPSSGAGDANVDDSFIAGDSSITVTLRDGELLDLEVTATPLRTKAGKPVRFRATVVQAGAGEQLSFSWYFSDGSSARGASATHRFKRPGSYNVVVGVTTPGDRVGASESIRVQVGKPRPGPDRTGGGVAEHSPLDSGPSRGGSGSGPATGLGAAGAAGRTSTAAPPAAADVVAGELLASTAAPTKSAQAAAAAAAGGGRAGARSGDPGQAGAGIPGVAWGLLVSAGMLGMGAVVELRGARGLRTW